MIEWLKLRQFKCFERLDLPLGNLTILSGFNAAGKSTSVQPLLLLAQSMRENSESRYISVNGPLVALGSAADAVRDTYHGEDLEIVVASDKADISWKLRPTRVNPGAFHLQSIKVSTKKNSYVSEANEAVTGLLAGSQRRIKDARDISHVLQNMVYISALRIGTPDLYPVPSSSEPIKANVGTHGEFAPWILDRLGDEDIDPARENENDRSSILRRQVNAWLGALFKGTEVNVRRLADTNYVKCEIRVNDREWKRPSNVGFGISYSLPVIVAALVADPGQILLIDSPEAHLHPEGQSRMGQFLAQIAGAGVQVIVETHSDHVLNGIRLSIQQKRLKPEQAALHFFAGTGEANRRVISPQIDSNGSVSEWPEGFFDQSEKDLAALTDW